MANFALIIACLLIGIVLRVSRRLPESAGSILGTIVIDVSFPALLLMQVPPLVRESSLGKEWLFPVLVPWILLLLSWLIFATLGRSRGWSRARIGALVLTAGLGNTSFVGYPMLEALLGAEGLRVGIVLDQLGSFLALSTVGLVVAAYYSGQSDSGMTKSIGRRVVSFPPFIALVVAVLWGLAGTPGREAVSPFLEKLALTLVPLALLSVGLQLKLERRFLRGTGLALTSGLGYRLFLGPLLVIALAVTTIGAHSLLARASVLEAGTGPMITAAIVATNAGLDAEIASLMVGLGLSLSLFTIPLWYFLLK